MMPPCAWARATAASGPPPLIDATLLLPLKLADDRQGQNKNVISSSVFFLPSQHQSGSH